jgi:AhpC/TSA family
MLAVVPALGALNVNTQPDKTPQEQYAELIKEFQKLDSDWIKLYTSAKTDEERKEILAKRPDTVPYAEKVFQLAEKYPKDAVAFEALVWVAQRNIAANKLSDRAVAAITKDYLGDARIVKILPLFARPVADNEKTLQAVIDKNPDKAVQGLAYFYLAQNFKSQSQTAERQKKAETATELMKKVEPILDRVVKEYGDIITKSPRNGKDIPLRELVEPELFEMRHLVVGKVVPDIEAEDIDGKTFKLSDYRGKVVMLDFWGHW